MDNDQNEKSLPPFPLTPKEQQASVSDVKALNENAKFSRGSLGREQGNAFI